MNVHWDFTNGKAERKWFPKISTNFGSKSVLCMSVAGDDGCMYIFLNCCDYFSSSVQL